MAIDKTAKLKLRSFGLLFRNLRYARGAIRKNELSGPLTILIMGIVGLFVTVNMYYRSGEIPTILTVGITSAGFITASVLELRNLYSKIVTRVAQRVIEESLMDLRNQGLLEPATEEILVQRILETPGVDIRKNRGLVRQKLKDHLVDEASFQGAASQVLVDFLQPSPRNAKRLINRLRVEVAVAFNRGLLRGDEKITVQHISRWLVLSERWPELAKALSIRPSEMVNLERESSKEKNSLFTQLVSELAPAYVSDKDLKGFCNTRPPLGSALVKLIHFSPIANRPS